MKVASQQRTPSKARKMREQSDAEVQARLHARAAKCMGTMELGKSASIRVREVVRKRLREKHKVGRL
jgi:hypothetical protein